VIAPPEAAPAALAQAMDGAGYAFGLWCGWGLLHSILAARRVKAAFALVLGPARFALYPLGYALVSVWTFWLAWDKAPDLPQILWDAPLALALPLRVLQVAGLALLVWAGLSVQGLKMLGLRQLADTLRGRPAEALDAPDMARDFVVTGAYGLVRHPMHAGGLLILACAPNQTLGGLVFAVFGCLYMLLGTRIEERRLAAELGGRWADYAARVPMLVPRLSRRADR
jgi:protein-S-isoprenylcysteine O-methyltransferase Ste14